MVLFASNHKYLMDDNTALAEIAEFAHAPREFGQRVQQTLGRLGSSHEELGAAVESIAQLFRETVEFTDGLCQPRFKQPK